MSRIKTENLHEELLKKKKHYSVKATSYLQGSIKNNFLDDCIKREWNESRMVKHIVDVYYHMTSAHGLSEKEPNEIKKYIIDKIKL